MLFIADTSNIQKPKEMPLTFILRKDCTPAPTNQNPLLLSVVVFLRRFLVDLGSQVVFDVAHVSNLVLHH